MSRRYVQALCGPRRAARRNYVGDHSVGLGSRAAQQCAKLLQTFQSRDVLESYHLPVEDQLPDTLYAIGEPSQVRYVSDKDDPDTREERHRQGDVADPEGGQGTWKRFYHDHDTGLGLQLYTGFADLRYFDPKIHPGLMGGDGSAADARWPDAVAWLAFLENVTWECLDGTQRKFRPPANAWGLWAFPDTKSLIAWPMAPSARASRFLVWRGGDLHVTWRGIQG